MFDEAAGPSLVGRAGKMKRWITGALVCLMMTTGVSAAPGDVLYIQGDGVNVRAGPGTDASVILKLNRGHKLVEFERRGDWVNVGVDRTGGKDGWVHRSLVGANFSGGGSTAPTDPKFDQFRAAVEFLNARARQRAGVDLFTKVENLGDGIVQISATDTWISAPYGDRQSNLNTLFDLWDAADGSGRPIMVRIVDARGNEVMKKGRD